MISDQQPEQNMHKDNDNNHDQDDFDPSLQCTPIAKKTRQNSHLYLHAEMRIDELRRKSLQGKNNTHHRGDGAPISPSSKTNNSSACDDTSLLSSSAIISTLYDAHDTAADVKKKKKIAAAAAPLPVRHHDDGLRSESTEKPGDTPKMFTPAVEHQPATSTVQSNSEWLRQHFQHDHHDQPQEYQPPAALGAAVKRKFSTQRGSVRRTMSSGEQEKAYRQGSANRNESRSRAARETPQRNHLMALVNGDVNDDLDLISPGLRRESTNTSKKRHASQPQARSHQDPTEPAIPEEEQQQGHPKPLPQFRIGRVSSHKDQDKGLFPPAPRVKIGMRAPKMVVPSPQKVDKAVPPPPEDTATATVTSTRAKRKPLVPKLTSVGLTPTSVQRRQNEAPNVERATAVVRKPSVNTRRTSSVVADINKKVKTTVTKKRDAAQHEHAAQPPLVHLDSYTSPPRAAMDAHHGDGAGEEEDIVRLISDAVHDHQHHQQTPASRPQKNKNESTQRKLPTATVPDTPVTTTTTNATTPTAATSTRPRARYLQATASSRHRSNSGLKSQRQPHDMAPTMHDVPSPSAAPSPQTINVKPIPKRTTTRPRTSSTASRAKMSNSESTAPVQPRLRTADHRTQKVKELDTQNLIKQQQQNTVSSSHTDAARNNTDMNVISPSLIPSTAPPPQPTPRPSLDSTRVIPSVPPSLKPSVSPVPQQPAAVPTVTRRAETSSPPPAAAALSHLNVPTSSNSSTATAVTDDSQTLKSVDSVGNSHQRQGLIRKKKPNQHMGISGPKSAVITDVSDLSSLILTPKQTQQQERHHDCAVEPVAEVVVGDQAALQPTTPKQIEPTTGPSITDTPKVVSDSTPMPNKVANVSNPSVTPTKGNVITPPRMDTTSCITPSSAVNTIVTTSQSPSTEIVPPPTAAAPGVSEDEKEEVRACADVSVSMSSLNSSAVAEGELVIRYHDWSRAVNSLFFEYCEAKQSELLRLTYDVMPGKIMSPAQQQQQQKQDTAAEENEAKEETAVEEVKEQAARSSSPVAARNLETSVDTTDSGPAHRLNELDTTQPPCQQSEPRATNKAVDESCASSAEQYPVAGQDLAVSDLADEKKKADVEAAIAARDAEIARLKQQIEAGRVASAVLGSVDAIQSATAVEKRLEHVDSELQRVSTLLTSLTSQRDSYRLEGKVVGLEHCVVDGAARTEQLTAQIRRIQSELHTITSQCPSPSKTESSN